MLRKSRNKPVVAGAFAVMLSTIMVLGSVSPASAQQGARTPAATLTSTETPAPTASPTKTSTESANAVPTPSITPTAIPSATSIPAAPMLARTASAAAPKPELQPQATLRKFAAVAPSGFQAGLIISDYNFYDSWAMTEAEIQGFLNWTVGTCANDKCLSILRLDTPTKTFSFGTCATYAGAEGETVARIIYKVQRACGISAKVLLTTLQKEQGLLTSQAPSDAILRKAMGYGCPDTSQCDANFYGLFNQLFSAARQLTWYGNENGSFTYIKVGQNNPIKYHPYQPCGAPNVQVENRATAALYYYTPYQPNQAALANLNGTGDGCSSYGNRNFSVYYDRYFGDPVTGSPTNATRISGEDRYSTATEISKSTNVDTGVAVAFVATGENFPDALSAAPAAASLGGPLLLTYPGGVPAATLAELQRLKPQKIVVVGGTDVITDSTYSALKGVQSNIQRIAGADRFETSRKIAQQFFPKATSAYLATGANFPDALSAGAAAGIQRVPVLLVDGVQSSVNAPTMDVLRSLGITAAKIVGGPAAVSSGIESSLKSNGVVATRLAGSDRYETSLVVNQDTFGPTTTSVFIATGEAFPDALAGAAAAGKLGHPLFVTRPGCVTGDLRTEIESLKSTSLKLLGGPTAISQKVAFMVVC